MALADITKFIVLSPTKLKSWLSELKNELANKQATLTQGTNITISNNTISAKDTTYTLSAPKSKTNGNATITLTPSSGTANNVAISGTGLISVSSDSDGKLTVSTSATSNTGTVTSVQVQATSPILSSTNTAQSSSLNTTISLANGYGDTKNPYGSKTKGYVLAAPKTENGTPLFRQLDYSELSGRPTGAFTYVGESTTDPISEGATISLHSTFSDGEVVSYNNKEFVRINGTWKELGDEGSYALKTISITGTGVLSGGGNLEANRTITHSTSGVAKGSYGPSTNASPTHSETFTVPYITVDSYGHITAASNKTITLPSSGNTDTKVTQTAISSGLTNYRPVIVGAVSSSDAVPTFNNTTDLVYAAQKLYIQPASGNIINKGGNIKLEAASSTAGCVMSYDSTELCMKFTFS